MNETDFMYLHHVEIKNGFNVLVFEDNATYALPINHNEYKALEELIKLKKLHRIAYLNLFGDKSTLHLGVVVKTFSNRLRIRDLGRYSDRCYINQLKYEERG